MTTKAMDLVNSHPEFGVTITPEGRWRPLVHASRLEPSKREDAVWRLVQELMAKGWTLICTIKEGPAFDEWGPIALMECTKEQYDEERAARS